MKRIIIQCPLPPLSESCQRNCNTVWAEIKKLLRAEKEIWLVGKVKKAIVTFLKRIIINYLSRYLSFLCSYRRYDKRHRRWWKVEWRHCLHNHNSSFRRQIECYIGGLFVCEKTLISYLPVPQYSTANGSFSCVILQTNYAKFYEHLESLLILKN